jgi:hypothetical protein
MLPWAFDERTGAGLPFVFGPVIHNLPLASQACRLQNLEGGGGSLSLLEDQGLPIGLDLVWGNA